MIRSREHDEVLRSIVVSLAVAVVDRLVGCQRAPDGLLGDPPVFEDVALLGLRMVGHVEQDVALRVDITPLASLDPTQLVVGQEPARLSCNGSGSGVRPLGDSGRLSTPALAQAARVGIGRSATRPVLGLKRRRGVTWQTPWSGLRVVVGPLDDTATSADAVDPLDSWGSPHVVASDPPPRFSADPTLRSVGDRTYGRRLTASALASLHARKYSVVRAKKGSR